jgi:hypothetical protein
VRQHCSIFILSWVALLATILTSVPLTNVALAQSPDYRNHPKLLLTMDDVSALQQKVQGNSTSATTYRFIRGQTRRYTLQHADTLLTYLEGLSTVPELGLVHLVEAPSLTPGKTAPPDYAALPSHHMSMQMALAIGAKLREVVLHLARTRSVDDDDYGSSLRLRSMALGYDMGFADATAGERQEVRDAIVAYMEYMPPRYSYYRYSENPHASNRGMMVGAAIGLGVIAVWDDVPAVSQAALLPLLDFGHQLVLKCLTDILASDGSYREGVLYAGWMMRHAIPYIEARRRFDGVDLADAPRVQGLADWLCYEMLPEGGGRTNNINDSLWQTRPLAVHTTYLDWAQARYASATAAYLQQHISGLHGYDYGSDADKVATVLWNQDMAIVNPGNFLNNGQLFEERGIYFYRSAWKNGNSGDEILFSFQSSQFWGGHAQEDHNHFTLYAYGDRFAVDHGAPGPNMEAKETAAHNVVLIDGVGQHNAGNSIGTDGRITTVLLGAFADYVCGDAASAYVTYSPFNAPDVPFPGSDWSWGYDGGNPVERADRHIVWVKGAGAPPYCLIADDIRKDGAPHQYDWRLHTDSTNVVDHATNPVVISGAQSELQLFFAQPQAQQGLQFHSGPSRTVAKIQQAPGSGRGDSRWNRHFLWRWCHARRLFHNRCMNPAPVAARLRRR